MKDIILKATLYEMVIIFLVSVCCLDSAKYMPMFVVFTIISGLWIFMFAISNEKETKYETLRLSKDDSEWRY